MGVTQMSKSFCLADGNRVEVVTLDEYTSTLQFMNNKGDTICVPDGYDLIDCEREILPCVVDFYVISKLMSYQLLHHGRVVLELKSHLEHEVEQVPPANTHH
jgi:hypothetical protein